MIKTKIWAEFIIDNFSKKHQELTKFLGIEPNEAENSGDLYKSKSGIQFNLKKSSWTLDSGCNTDVDLETQIKTLLDKIRPYKNRFIEVGEKYSLDLNIVIHIYGNNSFFIGWNKDIMKELAEYNASWGIDLSIYDAEDE